MADSYTQEGGGWTARCMCRWEVFRATRPDVERALRGHKAKCKTVTTGTP